MFNKDYANSMCILKTNKSFNGVQRAMRIVGYYIRKDGSIQEIIAPDHHRTFC